MKHLVMGTRGLHLHHQGILLALEFNHELVILLALALALIE